MEAAQNSVGLEAGEAARLEIWVLVNDYILKAEQLKRLLIEKSAFFCYTFYGKRLMFVSDKFEVAELINLPFEEKTVILYKKKKQALSINSNIR